MTNQFTHVADVKVGSATRHAATFLPARLDYDETNGFSKSAAYFK